MKKGLHVYMLFFVLMGALIIGAGCDPADDPDNGSDATAGWDGGQSITVTDGDASVSVALDGLDLYDCSNGDCVRLSDVVDKSAVTDTPDTKYYNLMANDGFSMMDMIIKKGASSGLPPWQDMQDGYLYDAGGEKGIAVEWGEDTVATQSGLGFYQMSQMDEGTIEIFDDDIN